MYLSIHFGQFLNGKIDTEEEEIAYKKIVEYLDKIEGIQLPDGLEEYLMKGLGQLEDEDMQKINNTILDDVNNTEEY